MNSDRIHSLPSLRHKASELLGLSLVILLMFIAFTSSSSAEAQSSVRIIVPAGMPTFAQPFARPGNAAIRFAVFDTLTREDSEGRLGPALALSWRMETSHSWVFSIRPQVQFHNGVPFSASTVAQTIDILKSSSGVGFDLASEASNIAKVEIIDDVTVRFHTAEPDPILPRRLGLIRMIEPSAWKLLGPERYAREPVGTGPYRISSWGTGAATTSLKAVASSWRAPKVIDRVEITNVPDGTARVQALLSGKADIVFGLSPEDIAPIEAAGAKTQAFPAPMVMGLTLRNVGDSHPALRDVRVRQALNYAIDREMISKQIMSGTMVPARTGFTAGVTGYNNAITPYAYDPERARRLLAEAGYPQGFKMVAGVTLGQIPNDGLVFQAVGQYLKAVGVDIELRSLTFPDYISKLTGGSWNGISSFSLLWGAATYADAYRALFLHSCENPSPYFCEPALLQSLNAARKQADPVGRERELQAAVGQYHAAAPAIWLLEYASIVGTTKNLQGLELAFEGVYIERMRWSKE